jgi:hypothetical protein
VLATFEDEALLNQANITFDSQIVFIHVHLPPRNMRFLPDKLLYNIGLDWVTTPHVCIAPAGFVFLKDSASILSHLLLDDDQNHIDGYTSKSSRKAYLIHSYVKHVRGDSDTIYYASYPPFTNEPAKPEEISLTMDAVLTSNTTPFTGNHTMFRYRDVAMTPVAFNIRDNIHGDTFIR